LGTAVTCDASGYITTFLQPTDALREETLRAADTALTLQRISVSGISQRILPLRCLKEYETASGYLEKRAGPAEQHRIPETPRLYRPATRASGIEAQYFAESERLDPRNPGCLLNTRFPHSSAPFPPKHTDASTNLDITPDDLDTIVTRAAMHK